MYSKIIHPTDLSEASVPALKAAHGLAKCLGADLLICYIAHPPLVASGETLTDPTTDQTRNIAEELSALQPSDPGVRRDVRILLTEEKTSVKTMLQFLENMEGELLVLGMHERGGIKGWLSPSITEEVVRRASCPVLVVKQETKEEQQKQQG